VSRVAVRIFERGGRFLVVGRQTSVVCATFEEAWVASIPYFAGLKR